jgi:DMSO/TMAO reductase YedYZ molybdopterin-dependent catalytic subunit
MSNAPTSLLLPTLLTRRCLVARLGALPIAYSVAKFSRAVEGQDAPKTGAGAGMIIREKEPANFEPDFASLDAFLTPHEKFYIRNHFPVPQIEHESWRLTIDGEVGSPLVVDYDELVGMPSETKTVTLECAGNGRVFLTPKVEGVQWQLGAVGTAEWTGVPLERLLSKARVRETDVEIILEGADSGEATKPSRPANPIHFARSLTLKQVQSTGVLLAYKMNGQPLSPEHGSPVRAIVPGWFGMASVKWLSRIVVTAKPFHGYFQTVDYAYWEHRDGIPTRTPVTQLQVKSQIARPAMNEEIPADKPYRVYGAAWTGGTEVTKVEVSVDGGKSFAPATLTGRSVANAWRLWEFSWTSPTAGRHVLMARATDAAGRTQPMERDKDRETYMINHVLPISVTVA